MQQWHLYFQIFYIWKIEWKWKYFSLNHGWLFATSWTITHQAPLSMGSYFAVSSEISESAATPALRIQITFGIKMTLYSIPTKFWVFPWWLYMEYQITFPKFSCFSYFFLYGCVLFDWHPKWVLWWFGNWYWTWGQKMGTLLLLCLAFGLEASEAVKTRVSERKLMKYWTTGISIG